MTKVMYDSNGGNGVSYHQLQFLCKTETIWAKMIYLYTLYVSKCTSKHVFLEPWGIMSACLTTFFDVRLIELVGRSSKTSDDEAYILWKNILGRYIVFKYKACSSNLSYPIPPQLFAKNGKSLHSTLSNITYLL